MPGPASVQGQPPALQRAQAAQEEVEGARACRPPAGAPHQEPLVTNSSLSFFLRRGERGPGRPHERAVSERTAGGPAPVPAKAGARARHPERGGRGDLFDHRQDARAGTRAWRSDGPRAAAWADASRSKVTCSVGPSVAEARRERQPGRRQKRQRERGLAGASGRHRQRRGGARTAEAKEGEGRRQSAGQGGGSSSSAAGTCSVAGTRAHGVAGARGFAGARRRRARRQQAAWAARRVVPVATGGEEQGAPTP